MWPFRRREPVLPAHLEALQRIHVLALELERRQQSVEHALALLGEGVQAAKVVDRRMAAMEQYGRSLAKALEDEALRLTGRIDHVQGIATGSRGGRPRNEEREADRQALELGRRVIQAAATPEGRAQLVLELQSTNGTVDPVGGTKWTPGPGDAPL